MRKNTQLITCFSEQHEKTADTKSDRDQVGYVGMFWEKLSPDGNIHKSIKEHENEIEADP